MDIDHFRAAMGGDYSLLMPDGTYGRPNVVALGAATRGCPYHDTILWTLIDHFRAAMGGDYSLQIPDGTYGRPNVVALGAAT